MIEEVNQLALKEITDYLLQSVKEVLKGDLICMLIHGSCVKGGLIRDFSDIDAQVFARESVFDEFGLQLEKSLKIQELIGSIDFSKLGASYLQMFFHNPKEMPDWYTPPIHGAYQILFGELPKELDFNSENFKMKMVNSLKRLRIDISNMIRSFTDSSDKQLLRRSRYVATLVYPTMYSLIAYNEKKPEELWIKPKNEVFDMFCNKYPGNISCEYLKEFFDSVKLLVKKQDDYDIARNTFASGIKFLKEAAKISDSIK